MKRFYLLSFFWFFFLSQSQAVMFYSTGDSTHNTTTPGVVDGLSANNIWDLQGSFGSFLGTPIASNYFITAKHIGAAGTSITFAPGSANAGTYNVINSFNSPNTDLTIWQVSGSFAAFAPLYRANTELNNNLIVFGRGTQRGTDYLDGASALRGWNWGTGDNVARWGRNVVSATPNGGAGFGRLLQSTFSSTGVTDEAMLSVGDSGGAVFMQDGGLWKLAGINYAVSGSYYSNTGVALSGTEAAIYNQIGLFSSGDNTTFNGPLGAGSGSFFATSISGDQDWIDTIIPVPEPSVNALLFLAAAVGVFHFYRRRARS